MRTIYRRGQNERQSGGLRPLDEFRKLLFCLYVHFVVEYPTSLSRKLFVRNVILYFVYSCSGLFVYSIAASGVVIPHPPPSHLRFSITTSAVPRPIFVSCVARANTLLILGKQPTRRSSLIPPKRILDSRASGILGRSRSGTEGWRASRNGRPAEEAGWDWWWRRPCASRTG